MFSLLCLSSSQLLKKWAPVFKNYVKRAQDHLDCLSAFEEHFLEQDSHWPAMVKVRVSTTYTQWSAGCYEGWTQEQEKNMGFFFFLSRSWWTCTSWRSWRRRRSCAGSPRGQQPTRADSSERTRGYVQGTGLYDWIRRRVGVKDQGSVKREFNKQNCFFFRPYYEFIYSPNPKYNRTFTFEVSIQLELFFFQHWQPCHCLSIASGIVKVLLLLTFSHSPLRGQGCVTTTYPCGFLQVRVRQEIWNIRG